MNNKKSNIETDENRNISKITIKLNNKSKCVRCGASKKSDYYKNWECGDEYCDTKILMNNYF
jgi:late competence protein required for DNA uptake (superfamily II DNA/RNA helicase)